MNSYLGYGEQDQLTGVLEKILELLFFNAINALPRLPSPECDARFTGAGTEGCNVNCIAIFCVDLGRFVFARCGGFEKALDFTRALSSRRFHFSRLFAAPNAYQRGRTHRNEVEQDTLVKKISMLLGAPFTRGGGGGGGARLCLPCLPSRDTADSLHIFAGIAPSDIRRAVASRTERTRQTTDERHPLNGHLGVMPRLKSRKSFIKCTEPINTTAKAARMVLWRERLEPLDASVHLKPVLTNTFQLAQRTPGQPGRHSTDCVHRSAGQE